MPTSLSLSRTQARRFLLAHQRLLPSHSLEGKAGVLEFIRHVGCIQFDPVSVVGRLPDLLLQSRLRNYTPAVLEGLLYQDRLLLDGFDKMQAIFCIEDYPYFARQRATHFHGWEDPRLKLPTELAPLVMETVRERGPLSSLDLDHNETSDWFWGKPVRQARSCLELLYHNGQLGIHHRQGTRRVYDLPERLIPVEILNAPEPFAQDEDYQEWHVMRRVGGLGLASRSSGEYWGGIRGVRGVKERQAVLERLVTKGLLLQVVIEELPKRDFYARAQDIESELEPAQIDSLPLRAAILPPLDNLLWDRKLLHWIFDFDYIWEVYKVPANRKFGHYTLPVLYGDHFIARTDLAYSKKTATLTLQNWWWEAGVEPDAAMQTALADCLRDFRAYLGGQKFVNGSTAPGLEWMEAV